MMSSELLIGYASEGLVIRVVGQGTMKESPAFRAAALAFLDSSGREGGPDRQAGMVVFDTSDCTYLDSTFLGSLIGIQKACESVAGGPHRRFVIAAPESSRYKLFSTSSLDKYFEFADACPQVIGEFESIDIDELDPEELGRHVMQAHWRLANQGGHDATAFRNVAQRLSEELDESTRG